jgi:hypothetical protein
MFLRAGFEDADAICTFIDTCVALNIPFDQPDRHGKYVSLPVRRLR